MNRRDKLVLEASGVAATQTSQPFNAEGCRGLRLFQEITELEGTRSTLSTNLAGENNDLVFTARDGGTAGDSITVAYTDPGGNDQPLEVVVTGTDIVVNLATGPGGAITSTAAGIAAAIAANAAANALVSVANKAANDGTGVVIAMVATPLASGADNAACTLKLQMQNPTTGTWMDFPGAAFATITSTTGLTQLTVYPGIAASANVAISNVISGPLRVVATLADVTSASFKVTASLLE